MPELPEVKTVSRILKKNILNKKIIDINIIYPRMISSSSLPLNKVIGKRIKDIKTKGKFILFYIDKYILISHLRMEGKFHLKSSTDEISKHEHIIFTFEDNQTLRYDDTRKFGRMELVLKENVDENKSLSKLGDEPFTIDQDLLYKKLSKKNIPIKTALLDQSIMSGLGNIYVDEVLFESRINPHRKSNTLTKKEVLSIKESAINILNDAINLGGTTIRSYTSSLGVQGTYQNKLKVHTKKECPICKRPLSKEKIGGRTSYFCSFCQK